MSETEPSRVERDALGEVRVPKDALYGPQTARAAAWSFSGRRVPLALVHALGRIKASAAHVHGARGRLETEQARAIEAAALEVADGAHDGQFVVDLFQTGSGTSTNMNANEVVARRAAQLLGGGATVHPNDHVNLGQSSNDVMPSATQLALVAAGHARLLPSLDAAVERLHELAARHWQDLRDGRTHLMRATPIRFGQQFRGYAEQLADARARLAALLERCCELPLGGTAVGTGVGCPEGFARELCAELARRTGLPLREADNHLAQGSLDAITWLVAGLRSAASTVYKVADDLRWQASDAFDHVAVPAMQPGSSIMPGKVNPVVCEAVAMACAQVQGNDAAVAFANTQGRFELNTMIPVVAHNALEAVELLAGAVAALREHVLDGLRVTGRAAEELQRNPILATGLNGAIGYDRASAIAKRALAEGRPVFEVAREHTDLDDATLRRLLDPERLCGEHGRARLPRTTAAGASDRVDDMSTREPRDPAAILAATTLSRAQKIEALRQLSYDVREREVATEEGMPGPRDVDLAAIRDALRELGADDDVGDAKQ